MERRTAASSTTRPPRPLQAGRPPALTSLTDIGLASTPDRGGAVYRGGHGLDVPSSAPRQRPPGAQQYGGDVVAPAVTYAQGYRFATIPALPPPTAAAFTLSLSCLSASLSLSLLGGGLSQLAWARAQVLVYWEPGRQAAPARLAGPSCTTPDQPTGAVQPDRPPGQFRRVVFLDLLLPISLTQRVSLLQYDSIRIGTVLHPVLHQTRAVRGSPQPQSRDLVTGSRAPARSSVSTSTRTAATWNDATIRYADSPGSTGMAPRTAARPPNMMRPTAVCTGSCQTPRCTRVRGRGRWIWARHIRGRLCSTRGRRRRRALYFSSFAAPDYGGDEGRGRSAVLHFAQVDTDEQGWPGEQERGTSCRPRPRARIFTPSAPAAAV